MLRTFSEMLISSPHWQYKVWETRYPTKSVVRLFYRDPLECIQSLLESPLIQDHIWFAPFQLFKTAEKAVRVYTEWLSGEAAWSMQVRLMEEYILRPINQFSRIHSLVA